MNNRNHNINIVNFLKFIKAHFQKLPVPNSPLFSIYYFNFITSLAGWNSH